MARSKLDSALLLASQRRDSPGPLTMRAINSAAHAYGVNPAELAEHARRNGYPVA